MTSRIFKIGRLPFVEGLSILFLWVGISQKTYAQNDSTKVVLPTVEVEGRRVQSYTSDYSYMLTKTQAPILQTPASISSVTKELINDKLQYSLQDISSDVAGVASYSGFDEYTIRGFRAENARLFNGLRGYNSKFASPMLVNVERIEILKGPAATLYGNSDPGGSINLVSKKPLDTNRASVSVMGGSWDHWRFMGDVTGPLNKSKTLLYRLNAGYDTHNSFRDNQFAHSYQIAPSLSFIPNDKLELNVEFSLSHTNTVLDRGVPGIENESIKDFSPIRLTLNQKGDRLKETDIATSIFGSYKFNKHISFNTGYLNYISNEKVAEHGFQSYLSPDTIGLYYTKWNYKTVTHSLTNYFSFRFKTGPLKHDLVAGWDYIQTKINRGDQDRYEVPSLFGKNSGIVSAFSLRHPVYETPDFSTYVLSDADNENNEVDADIYRTQGLYIQEFLTWNRWKLLAGIRREFYRGADDDDDASSDEGSADADDDDDEVDLGGKIENIWLPKVALLYDITPNVTTYVQYSKGFDPFEQSNDLQIFKNPFKPIVSQLYEFGAKGMFFNQKLMATLAVYRLDVKNTAVNANDPSQPDLYVQHGEDRSQGIELELNGNILPNLSVNINYAYDVAKVQKSDVPSEVGNLKENAPKNISNSWIKYTFDHGFLSNLSIMLGHSQVSRRNTLTPGLRLPGYVIFNGALQYRWHHIEVFFNLDNILNKVYWQSAYNNIYKWPGAPRNFMAGFTYNL
ncbi:MAG: TonB-dependent siderophore receptor [Prevotella sp.]|nr:TonB-dependent siderophore receptor [Prevotella sp.]MCH3994634.1 TonB-dependent siderophore receptor [Prevotella sp.]MCI1246301.1 TonB-dependent siderophore receptor [Prevotella sp.]